MASRFTELAIDCADPAALARFWCAVLGYQVRADDDGVITIGSPAVDDGNRAGPVPPVPALPSLPPEVPAMEVTTKSLPSVPRELEQQGYLTLAQIHEFFG